MNVAKLQFGILGVLRPSLVATTTKSMGHDLVQHVPPTDRGRLRDSALIRNSNITVRIMTVTTVIGCRTMMEEARPLAMSGMCDATERVTGWHTLCDKSSLL